MNLFSRAKLLTALVVGAILSTFALAHEGHRQQGNEPTGSLIKATEAGVSAEWLAKAKADYPLVACPVSEEKFTDGEMGPPQDFVYRQEGMPDRLVRLCCKNCIRDFKKDPSKYLRAIDAADAAKAKSEHKH